MAFLKKPLKWTAIGQEPSELKKTEGFKMDESPAPGHFDFMFRSTYEAIEELQQKAGEVKTVNNVQPDGNGNVLIPLPDVSKFYQKPTTGIPKTDLSADVQSSLVKADSALQSVTKADIGLGNVDNTSDANKPVSTAQQTALNQKANIASPTFTGTPKAPTAVAGTNTTQLATTAFVKTAVDNSATTINDSIATHKADLVSHGIYGTATGTNTLVISNSNVTAYVEGMLVAFKTTTANTSAVTLNINNLGAKPIKKANGNDLSSGNLKVGGIYQARYDGANFILLGEGGEYGTVTANDVRKTKTFGTENGVLQGTLDLTNLIANNIRKGVTIDGVAGNVDLAYFGGKYFATGQSNLNSTKSLIVTTLSFKPSIVIIYANDIATSGYTADGHGIDIIISAISPTAVISANYDRTYVYPDKATLNSNGFSHTSVYLMPYLLVNWIAIG